jgi:DNA replication and repair protein RecF
MRARNKLLADEAWDADWLDALESQMEEHGLAVSRARMKTIIDLTKAVWDIVGQNFPASRLYLQNVTPGLLKTRLAASRKVDAAARRATHGPNAEDLLVYYGQKQRLASQCSTGEQKALLLGLVLAHAELVAERRGAPPILLLDEVAAHLDPKRRAALFNRLEGRGQVWITATEAALFNGISAASRFRIEPGIVHPE